MPGLSRMTGSAKKALLIGCQYTTSLKEHGQELRGAHQDPEALRDLLTEVYGYKNEDITILIDDKEQKHVWPTRENVLNAMRALVVGLQPGDQLVFSFSGHGSQVPNLDKTEEDGQDETLITVDTTYDSNNEIEPYSSYIKDDLVKEILVDAIPPGARLVMIFDCCHSGTASDLPTVFMDSFASPCSPISSPRPFGSRGFAMMQSSSGDWDAFPWIRSRARGYSLPLGSPLPDVTSWSACMDSQVTFGTRRGGMFIKALTTALRNEPYPTHARLLQGVREELANVVANQNGKRKAKGIDQSLVSPRAQLSSLKNATSLYHARFTL